MQNGDIVQIGSGCSQTNDGKHQVEDHCRMCGQSAGLKKISENEQLIERIYEIVVGTNGLSRNGRLNLIAKECLASIQKTERLDG